MVKTQLQPVINVERANGVAVVTFRFTNFVDLYDQLGRELLAQIGDREMVVVDLKAVTFFPGQGFATLKALSERLKETGGKLRLCSLSNGLRGVLNLSNGRFAFDIDENAAEAMRELADYDF